MNTIRIDEINAENIVGFVLQVGGLSQMGQMGDRSIFTIGMTEVKRIKT